MSAIYTDTIHRTSDVTGITLDYLSKTFTVRPEHPCDVMLAIQPNGGRYDICDLLRIGTDQRSADVDDTTQHRCTTVDFNFCPVACLEHCPANMG